MVKKRRDWTQSCTFRKTEGIATDTTETAFSVIRGATICIHLFIAISSPFILFSPQATPHSSMFTSNHRGFQSLPWPQILESLSCNLVSLCASIIKYAKMKIRVPSANVQSTKNVPPDPAILLGRRRRRMRPNASFARSLKTIKKIMHPCNAPLCAWRKVSHARVGSFS